MVDPLPKFTPPAIVTLLKPIVPLMVPVPAKAIVPVPAVKTDVPFANVTPEAKLIVPPVVISTAPPLVRVPVTVIAPDAPNVIPDEAFIVRLLKVVFVAAALRVILLATVTFEPASGTAFPNQVEPVFQSVAALVM